MDPEYGVSELFHLGGLCRHGLRVRVFGDDSLWQVVPHPQPGEILADCAGESGKGNALTNRVVLLPCFEFTGGFCACVFSFHFEWGGAERMMMIWGCVDGSAYSIWY